MRRSTRPRRARPGRPAAPLLALAFAAALVAGAGAQGGGGAPPAPAPVDTGLVRPVPAPGPVPAAAGDSLVADSTARATLPDSVALDSSAVAHPDSAVFDSLAGDSARGWRVVVPRADSLRAAAIPIDRSAWITWTPRVSKLALPMDLLRDSLFTPEEPWLLRYPLDARAVKIAVDPQKGTITQSLSAADVDLARAREIPLEEYARDLTARNLRREWVEQSRNRIDNIPQTFARDQNRGPLTFALPVTLPKAAQSILGRGGPSLNVSGSERISIAGTSNWDNLTSGTGVKRSIFPSLDMKQDLDIRLDGSLGDKVRVDVAQNSATTVPLANRIGIRYTGYEDEILKNLDLGNTNLSLPGTQYVSYSGRNEGLFGVKAAAKIGGTDLAVIASKQEGRSERRSFQGTAQEVTRTIDDLNYVKGKYFFLQRPAEQLAFNRQVDVRTVQVFIDNKNGSDDQGVRFGYAEVDPTGPRDSAATLRGAFDGLRPLQDYEISTFFYGERFPILILKNAIANSHVLAVAYEEVLPDGSRRQVGVVPELPADQTVEADSVRLKLLQVPRENLKAQVGNTDYYETDPAIDPFVPVREHELRNVYDLQTANIDPKSLSLQVRRYDAATEEATDAYKEGSDLFPYLRIIGADLFKDNGSGTALEGPDQIVDQFTNAYWLDAERGILFFPDLRPFDPRVGPRPDARPEEEYFFRPRLETDQSIPGLRGRIFWPEGMENPPGVTTGGVTPEDLESNPNPYDKRNIQQVQDRRYYIWAKFAGQDYSGTIFLGQTGILEGSEVVAIEGVPLERNKDYSIDYEAGTVTLLTAKARESRSRLSIDYSYAPLFAQAGKTLVGGTFGFRDPNRALGGAFIYEAKGQQESRPRLGEEPSRTLIGDVYADFRLKPQFLTDLVDRLPFYSTTEPSQLDVNGEVGLSMPNPNTKNTVYLDDFEGNRDSYTAPMSRGFWKWPSVPLTQVGAAIAPVDADYTELIWYNPVNTVEARDLNPRLTRAEGAENLVTVLDLYVPRAPSDSVRQHPALWTGITTTVEPDGADFSRLQYLELWLNDWRDPDVRMDPDLKLHVDLGLISEDQQRAPNAPPNGVFDTEDRNRDGKFDSSEDPATREDSGADGIPDEAETGFYDLSTTTSADLHGDNFRVSEADLGDDDNRLARLDPQNYVGPTLSEKSKGTYEVGSRLFTEDLDTNQSLDTANDYVTFTLPLGDEAALAPFLIFAAESTLTVEGTPVAPNNGWRRYRIPLDASDPAVRQVINGGSLANVKHMRVWLEGFDTFQGLDAAPKLGENERGRQPLIQLAAIDVVGNRWRGADSAMRLANGSVVARNINNQEDRNIYDPPFPVETSSSGGSTQTQREQSIALEVSRLPVGSTATIFKDQTLAEDYTRYGRLGFYQTAFGFSDEDSARFFLRMGYDDRNYYEYSRPIRGAAAAPFRPTPWNEYVLTLTDFTDVKLNRPAGALADTVDRGDERFVVVGQPTFTRIQRLTIGVFSEKAYPDSAAAARAATTMSGQVWVDDLRALDVDRSKGVANRLTVFTKVADLFNVTTNWDRTDENFQRLGQTRGSDIRSDRLSFVGQVQPHRFLAHTGINFPVSFGYTRITSTPRLRTGTDLFLRGEDAIDERSSSVDRNLSVSLQKTGDRNPILKNTIGRLGVNFSFADRVGRSPTGIDSSRTLSAGGSYSIAPAEWFKVPLPLWKLRGGGVQQLKILPETATISYNRTTTSSFIYKRGLEDAVGQYDLQSEIFRKSALYQLGATWRPLPFGSYSVSATRNAHIPGIPPATILGINFGRMTNFNQRIDGRFTVPVHSFFRPSFDFSTNYAEVRTPDLSPNLSLGTFSNSTNAGVRWELPFTRLAGTKRTPPTPPTPSAPPPTRTAFVDSAAADTSAAGRPATPPAATTASAPAPDGGGFSLPVGRLLSRLGNVSMSLSFTRSTSFSRYTGVPSVPYRLGLVRDPDTQWSGIEVPSIFPGAQAADNANRSYTGDVSTTIGLIGRSTARVRVSYTNLNRVYNQQMSGSENLTLPDVQFDWGQVTNLLRLGGVFTAVNAQSKVSFVRTLEGPDLSSPTSRVRTRNLSPLIQLSGQMKSTANVQLSIDRRSSTREDFTIRRAIRREGDFTVRGSISRSYLPGQKFPLFGSKGLKSTLTMSLDGSFNKRTNSTESNFRPTETKTDKLDFNGSGTYSFSNYVNGTVGLGFSQSRDLVYRINGDPRTNRSLRLEASANVRF